MRKRQHVEGPSVVRGSWCESGLTIPGRLSHSYPSSRYSCARYVVAIGDRRCVLTTRILRRMTRWTVGLGMMVLGVSAAGGQDHTGTEKPLRAAYYTCVKASQGVTLALNNCIGTEYDFQDRRLNTVYKALHRSMSDAQRNDLRIQERAWMTDRDKDCAPPANGGTADMLGANECRLDRTAKRAAEVEARMPPLAASTTLADSGQIPTSLQPRFTTQDTVLAMKTTKPLGKDDGGTVVVVRHSFAQGGRRNPCELIVLKNDGGQFSAAEKNDKVVECTYNPATKSAAALGLNSNLIVTSNQITYFNELARGGTTYSFAWSEEKSAWHLQHVEASSVQNGDNGIVVYKSVLDYPSTLSWISLADFDPALIRESIARNRKIVK